MVLFMAKHPNLRIHATDPPAGTIVNRLFARASGFDFAADWGKANGMTAFWAALFFWLRLTHAAVYLLGIPYVRTIVFTGGFVAVAGIFWEIIK